MTDAHLRLRPPARSQFRAPRRATPTGLTVIHTAENLMDHIGPDTGAESVAEFIRARGEAGSYHDIVDSDSCIQLVRYEDEAYQDGTGSNPFALSISFALRARDWTTLSATRRHAFLEQGAVAFARQQRWLAGRGLRQTPLHRITKAASDLGVAGFIEHGARDPSRRYDPGEGFPWAEWYEACASALQPATPSPTPPVQVTATLPVLGLASDGKPVRKLQGLLVAHGHTITVDGDFGPNTRAALVRHQDAHGLPADGRTWAGTWRTLIER